MRFRARLTGYGEAAIEAFGSADAEARLEKELARALPGSTLVIRALRRPEDEPRIVETFVAEYLLRSDLEVEGTNEESARRAAFSAARRALSGSRFQRVAWDRAVLTPA